MYLVAGSQKTASRVRRQTSLQPGGLSVVMSIDNDPPVSVDIPGSLGHGIQDFTWAQVAFRSNPVRHVIRRRSLRSPSVVLVIKSVLGVLVQVLHQVIGGLVRHIRVFLLEQVVGGDGCLDLVFRVLGIFQAVMEASGVSAVGGQFGVAIPLRMVSVGCGVVGSRGGAVSVVGRGGWVVVGSIGRGGVVDWGQGLGHHHSDRAEVKLHGNNIQ